MLIEIFGDAMGYGSGKDYVQESSKVLQLFFLSNKIWII